MKKKLIILVTILAFTSLLFDKQVSLLINFDSAFLSIISSVSISLINQFTLLIISFLITKIKQWKTVIPIFFFLGVIFMLFKFIIQRQRPFEVLDLVIIKNIDYDFASWNTSFPSWHTATLAMLIPFVEKDKIRIIILCTLIFFISFSRLFAGIHYLSDVLFGLLIGYLIGDLAKKYSQKIKFFKDS